MARKVDYESDDEHIEAIAPSIYVSRVPPPGRFLLTSSTHCFVRRISRLVPGIARV
jgi:hypothetical protein